MDPTDSRVLTHQNFKLVRAVTIYFLSTAFLQALVPTNAKASDELDRLRSQFELKMVEMNSSLVALDTNYESRLSKLEGQVQAAGQLEKVLAVREEREGFAKGTTKAAIDFSELAQLQKIYSNERTRITGENESRLNSMVASYRRQLEALKGALTREQKVDDALAVEIEIVRVGKMVPGNGGGTVNAEGPRRKDAAGYEILEPVKIENPIPGVPNGDWHEIYFIVESDQSEGRLQLEFSHPNFGTALAKLSAAVLLLVVGATSPADTADEIVLYAKGETLASKEGAKLGERLRLELDATKLAGMSPVIIEVRCGGNAVLLEKGGELAPRLLVKFDRT